MSKHGPTRLSKYAAVHETIMRQFRDQGFIDDRDTLRLERFDRFFILSGQVGCLGEIVLSVMKILRVCDEEHDPRVQTTMYAYDAAIRGVGNIFRYDNQHPDHLRVGHFDPHHKHLFAFGSPEELAESPVWIGETNWPTLGEVVAELQAWHSDHYHLLPRPNDFPPELSSNIRSLVG